jgi:peptidoglycan/LPS O-acetylase OafA/YrhL
MLEKLPKYSVWFDFIRGCAALAVFIGHARVLFLSSIVAEIGLVSKTRVSPALTTTESISCSHQAVIIFFVVSGYFVGGSVIRGLRSNTWSSTDYIIQRLTRLWTVLVPALALTTLLDLTGISIFGTDGIYGAPLGQRMVFPNILDRLTIETFISNLCFIQVIAAPTYGTNSPLWTLAYEFWFYLSFPFLAMALWRQTALQKRLTCFAALTMIGFFVGWHISLYFLFWLAGCSLELIPKCISEKIAARLFCIVGIIFVVLCVVLVKLNLQIFISDATEVFVFCILCYCLLHLTSLQTPSYSQLYLQRSRKCHIRCICATLQYWSFFVL